MKNVSVKAFSRTSYFFILFLWSICSSSLHGATPPQKSSTQYDFQDILLVVHYNHPFYQTKDFIKKLYSPYFPNIVFYGETAHKDVIAVPAHIGYLFSRVVYDALQRFPNYRGYLFLQDDCILNFWNLKHFNKDKIWYGLPNRHDAKSAVSLHSKFPTHNRCSWWDTPWGFVPAKKAFSRLSETEKQTLAQNIGPNKMAKKVADMFYLPQTVRKDAIRLSYIFRDVFLEISIPNMICCLSNVSNIQNMHCYWGRDLLHKYQPNQCWSHSIKLSDPANRAFVKKQIETYANQ